MEQFYSLVIIAAVVFGGLYLVIKLMRSSQGLGDSDAPGFTVPKYHYTARKYIMTQAESDFFRRLEQLASDRYYIFSQVHLSSLLDHTVKGQNWKGALSAIQRKSVDFVLVDKETLETVYAVELDDNTHDKADRQERDSKVEQYLQSVNIPLVRFRNVLSMTDEQIEAEFTRAKSMSQHD